MPEAEISLARARGITIDDAHNHAFLKAEAEEIQTNAFNERKIKAGWVDCFKRQNKTLYRTLLGEERSHG
jgi:SP family sugar:H+ symporter-like MFS transporter